MRVKDVGQGMCASWSVWAACHRRRVDALPAAQIFSVYVSNILRPVSRACAREGCGQQRCFITVHTTTNIFEEGAQAGHM